VSAPRLSQGSTDARRPRVGFLGLGWIGRSRLEVLHAAGAIEPVGVADPDDAAVRSASALAGGARICRDLDDLIALRPDGIVIATPTAQHAEQAVRALTSGCAVFCQKPLALESSGTRRVLEAARRADRLLGVDLSYRHTRGMRRVRDLIASGAIGRVYAAELVFHNAYGPDQPWYYDPARSGGGCLLDLGIHLADLVLWALGFPRVDRVSARLMAAGRPLQPGSGVEDYATARLDLSGGTTALLTCSWNLPAGRDAVIRAEFYGTEGGLSFTNRDGSFFEFEAQQYRRNTREPLCADAREDWWGAAALAWAAALAQGPAFDPAADRLIAVADLLDSVYGSATSEAARSDPEAAPLAACC
jgi:predicted dehydrogenase